jgi:hypothetical protein
MKLRLAKLAVIIVAVAGVVAGVSTGNATAFSVSPTGCPGSVQVPTTNGYFNYGAPQIELPQRFVWRSPCYSNYQQNISVRYRVWGFVRGTGWVLKSSVTRSATAGSTGAWITGLSGASPSADVSVDVLVEWRLTNGYLVGSKYVNYNAIGDYRCMSALNCGVFSNSDVGAFIHFVTGY